MSERINKLINIFYPKNNSSKIKTTKKAKKIICEELIEEISKMKIYKYPKYPSKFILKTVADNAKIILFLEMPKKVLLILSLIYIEKYHSKMILGIK